MSISWTVKKPLAPSPLVLIRVTARVSALTSRPAAATAREPIVLALSALFLANMKIPPLRTVNIKKNRNGAIRANSTADWPDRCARSGQWRSAQCDIGTNSVAVTHDRGVQRPLRYGDADVRTDAPTRGQAPNPRRCYD